MKATAGEAGEQILRLIVSRANAIVHEVLLEFERSLEDGKLTPDVRRRMLDALASVSEQVDYAGRVLKTPEARERVELAGLDPPRPWRARSLIPAPTCARGCACLTGSHVISHDVAGLRAA